MFSATLRVLIFNNYYFKSNEGFEDLSTTIIAKSPLLIKIAQWFSTREDIMDVKKRRILQKFQSFAPIDDFNYVSQTLIDDPVINMSDITKLDKIPIASGSIAQVHRCLYKNKPCALKIIHENAGMLLIDLKILISFLNFLRHFVSYLNSINYNEIFDELSEQTNLRKEYDNYQAVGHNLRKTPLVVVPKVYQASSNCLAMEYYDGVHFDQLLKSEQTDMRKRMICLFYKMVLRDKLCHGDFHPGNFIFKKKNNTIEMCVLDFGVTHKIENKTQKALYYLYKSISSGNSEDVEIFFRNALEKTMHLGEILPYIIRDYQTQTAYIKKHKVNGKGSTPAYIKTAFKITNHYNESFSGTVFNMMLQILMLHENVDIKDKNKSIFMEAFNDMSSSSYYVGQLGYKIKTLKDAMISSGYEL